MGYTAYLGGQVRHTEVRPAGASAVGAAVESNEGGIEPRVPPVSQYARVDHAAGEMGAGT